MKIVAPILERLCVRVLRSRPVPRHVCFVADGARRFGRKYGIPVQENHEIGLYGVMLEVIDWCLLFGIPEYSILMYSFGNYHRPKEEVGHWIDVLRLWLVKCIINWPVLQKKGIRFNFYGKFSLIPEDINGLMGMLVLITRNNTKLTVNMAMGYTGKHEMSSVAYDLYSAVRAGKLGPESLTVEFFRECLFAIDNRDVDLLIRTSGFKRISDFLSWQIARGWIYFNDVLWPEFSKYQFLKAIFYYQCFVTKQQNAANFKDSESQFLERFKLERRSSLLKYCVDVKFFAEGTSVGDMYTCEYETLYRAFKLVYADAAEWYQ